MTDTSCEPTLAPAEWGAPRHRQVTWYEPTALHAGPRSGKAFLEAIRDGVVAPPPMASVFGFRIVEVDVGRVVFTCEPDESTYNPLGVVHGGLVCTLLDTVAGCAVHSTLDAGVSYTSIDLSVSYLRAVTVDSGELRATGIATKVGRRVGFAESRVTDAKGRDVATATSSLLVITP
jgi:uncharacterized protein (TIGR00369 family)